MEEKCNFIQEYGGEKNASSNVNQKKVLSPIPQEMKKILSFMYRS